MDWSDVASVELPQGAVMEDVLGVVDKLVKHAEAAVSPKRPAGLPAITALDPTVEEALEVMVDARDALRTAEAQRVAAGEAAPDEDPVVANADADDAWRANERFLDGKRYLPDRKKPGRKEAGALYTRLFGDRDGLRFINLRPSRQWHRAQELLAILEEPKNRQLMVDLGGERELKALERTHREYGVAFGFLEAQALAPESVTDTRPHQLALQAALRTYLLKVAARVSKRDASSAVLARYLLQPYGELVDDVAKGRRAKKPSPDAGAPSPA